MTSPRGDRAVPTGTATQAAGDAGVAEARALTKRFGDVVAVDRVDLAVGAGEVVGLLGANGAGKTTLMRLLLGLMPVSGGWVALFGMAPSRATRRRVGYVPQGLGLYEDLTVAENLSFAAAAYGVPVVPPPDLGDVAETRVRDLPLGIRRRVAFAAALQHGPELLVLDEPTSGVDVVARSDLWDTIRTATERGAAAIVSTHHMDEASRCDRLVLMAAGRVVAEGTLDRIIGRERTVVVHAEEWTKVLEAVGSAGLSAALVGTTVRVHGAAPEAVHAVLERAGIDAALELVAPTLDEVFAGLVAGGRRPERGDDRR